MKSLSIGLLSVVCFSSWSQAYIVATNSPSSYETAGGVGVGFDYVGRVTGVAAGDGSGVYLGNYGGSSWVLTANHVGSELNVSGGSFTIGSTVYNVVSGSYKQIFQGSKNLDLGVFRVTDVGGSLTALTNLTIRSTNLAADAPVNMIGVGQNQSAQTFYDVTAGVWTEQGSPIGAEASGYKWTGGATKRGGTNSIGNGDASPGDGYTNTISYSLGQSYNNQELLYTDFDAVVGQTQGSLGDSGSAVFSAGTLELAGITVVTSTFGGQPGSTAIFGNQTYAVNLSAYRNEILAAAPEPGSLALLAVFLGASGLWVTRKKRAQHKIG